MRQNESDLLEALDGAGSEAENSAFQLAVRLCSDPGDVKDVSRGLRNDTPGFVTVVLTPKGSKHSRGGRFNAAESPDSVVVGGKSNSVGGDESVVLGGEDNDVTGMRSVSLGAFNNDTSFDYDIVP